MSSMPEPKNRITMWKLPRGRYKIDDTELIEEIRQLYLKNPREFSMRLLRKTFPVQGDKLNRIYTKIIKEMR